MLALVEVSDGGLECEFPEELQPARTRQSAATTPTAKSGCVVLRVDVRVTSLRCHADLQVPCIASVNIASR
jgi:hypothetical protein